MVEQRRAGDRKRVLLQGRIVFNNRFSIIECTIKDISPGGAQLAFEHPFDIPPRFDLEIPSRGQSFHCEVRWSRDKRHGVRFVTEPQAPPGAAAGPDLAQCVDPTRQDLPATVEGTGWLIQVLAGDPPVARLFAVGEPDAGAALARLAETLDLTGRERIEPMGRLSALAISRLQIPPGAALDIST